MQTHSVNYFSDLFKIWQQFIYKVGHTRRGQLKSRDMFGIFFICFFVVFV